MEYEQKYIKYKSKYLNLKNNMYGGVYKKHGTYTDDNYIYLLDLMFEYIKNITSEKIKIDKLIPQLKNKDWGDFSPIEIIHNKNLSIDDYDRIINADLRYPIIITENNKIVDGMHRLAKAYLMKKKYIKAYIFDKELMEKFIISKKKGKEWDPSDWNYYESLTKKDIDQLYRERFSNDSYDAVLSDKISIHIVKKIASGAYGTVYLVKKDNKLYALKRQKILEESIEKNFNYALWRELDFYDWISALDKADSKFFVKLLDYKIYRCAFIYEPNLSGLAVKFKKYRLRLAKSPYCIDQLLELKGDTIDDIMNKITTNQIYSIVIQILYALYLMHDAGYYHLDAHSGNIVYNKTSDSKCKIKLKLHNQLYQFDSFGYQISLIDYGEVEHKKFKPDSNILEKMNHNDDVWPTITMLTGGYTEPSDYNNQLKILYHKYNDIYQKIKLTINQLYPEYIVAFASYEKNPNMTLDIPDDIFYIWNCLFKIYDKKLYCEMMGIVYVPNMMRDDHIELIVRNLHTEDITIKALIEYLNTKS